MLTTTPAIGLLCASCICPQSHECWICRPEISAASFSANEGSGEEPRYGRFTVAEGIAIKVPGELTLPIVAERADHIHLVDEPLIERAVLMLLEIEKTVAEGAGAVGLAALLDDPDRFAGRKVMNRASRMWSGLPVSSPKRRFGSSG